MIDDNGLPPCAKIRRPQALIRTCGREGGSGNLWNGAAAGAGHVTNRRAASCNAGHLQVRMTTAGRTFTQIRVNDRRQSR